MPLRLPVLPRLQRHLPRHRAGVRRAPAVVVIGCALAALVTASTAAASADTDPVVTHAPAKPAPVADGPGSAGLPLPSPAPAAGATPAVSHHRGGDHPAPANRAAVSALAANGIPSVALNAYRVAAARMASADPGCGIDWALLAGIGRVESDHGRFGGAVLHSDGTSTPRIIGPALDGTRWDFIPAPANGLALDGDALYAHALGPMQFIPSTWAIYGTDADGDGSADIFDINDAALSAARYLCTAGGNLRAHSGQVTAVLAYNHSDTYLAQVLALADAYRHGVPVSGIPTGATTGPLPPVHNTGMLPPANPGPPTAVSGKAAQHSGGPATTPATKQAAPGKHRTQNTRDAHPRTDPAPSSTPRPTQHTSTQPAAHPHSTQPRGGSTTNSGSPDQPAGPVQPSTSASSPAAPSPSTGSSSTTSSTAAPSPSPTPTATKKRICLVWDLFVKGRCDVWL